MSRRLILMAIAATLGLLAIWYVAFWSPQSTSLQHARRDAADAVGKEHDLKTQIASVQRQRAKLPAMKAQLAQLDRAVPKAPNLDQLIDDVNAVAVRAGVSVATFSPSQPSAKGATASTGPEVINLNIGVNGTYFQIVDFVNNLNSMPRLVVIDGLSLSTPDKDGKMSVTIPARVFMVTPAAPAAAKTSTTTKSTP